jgi:hypothetical protein
MQYSKRLQPVMVPQKRCLGREFEDSHTGQHFCMKVNSNTPCALNASLLSLHQKMVLENIQTSDYSKVIYPGHLQ